MAPRRGAGDFARSVRFPRRTRGRRWCCAASPLLLTGVVAACRVWTFAGLWRGRMQLKVARLMTAPASWSASPGRRRVRGCAPISAGGGTVPELWKVGPVRVHTGPAQKALYLLKEDPMLFDVAVDEELETLRRQNAEAEVQRGTLNETAKKDMLALRRRMEEVRRSECAEVATELLYLRVCSMFRQLGVPLIPPVRSGGDVKFCSVDLKGLTTDIYSKDALELVREHLFSIVGQDGVTTATPLMGGLVVQIALIQASQVYAMSSLFGYYLRRMDARYQLESLAGSFGAWGGGVPSASSRKSFGPILAGQESGAENSLKDYINSFGPEQMLRMTSIASVEAQAAMERQVAALFGDLRLLKRQLRETLGTIGSPNEAIAKLQLAIQSGQVESVHMTSDDIRRIVLEAVAFGALLNDSEKQVETIYELTPKQAGAFGAISGMDNDEPALLSD